MNGKQTEQDTSMSKLNNWWISNTNVFNSNEKQILTMCGLKTS